MSASAWLLASNPPTAAAPKAISVAAPLFFFVDRALAKGIDVPIVPGIMPITNLGQIERFTTMCGASIPEDLHNRLHEAGDDSDRVTRIGIEYATQQCRELLTYGAPGVHFYTLNKSRSTVEIIRRLRTPPI